MNFRKSVAMFWISNGGSQSKAKIEARPNNFPNEDVVAFVLLSILVFLLENSDRVL